MLDDEAQRITASNRTGRRSTRRNNRSPSHEAQILRLAYELREGGIAECGLGFALTTLGAAAVAEAIADPEPFGRGSRLRAVRCDDRDERAAWTILSACQPAAVERRLQAAGVAPNATRVRADRRPGPRSTGRPDLRLVGGIASLRDGVLRTSIGDQLGPVAAALFGQARAA